MSEWLTYLPEGGFAIFLGVVLWFVGKAVGAWIKSSQLFQQKMVLRAESQQRDMSAAWTAMLGEVEATNRDFAEALKELVESSKENGQSQTRAIEQTCVRLDVHEKGSAQRDDLMTALLQRLVDTPLR